jgi:hypothetical protein
MKGTIRIYLHESHLSDGSLVYAVSLGPNDSESRPLVLDAVTLNDALLLADKLKKAIRDHTNEEVEVVELSEVERYGTVA